MNPWLEIDRGVWKNLIKLLVRETRTSFVEFVLSNEHLMGAVVVYQMLHTDVGFWQIKKAIWPLFLFWRRKLCQGCIRNLWRTLCLLSVRSTLIVLLKFLSWRAYSEQSCYCIPFIIIFHKCDSPAVVICNSPADLWTFKCGFWKFLFRLEREFKMRYLTFSRWSTVSQ